MNEDNLFYIADSISDRFFPGIPVYSLRAKMFHQFNHVTQTTSQKGREKKEEKTHLRCYLCQHLITHEELAIAVAGTHQHTFINPAGVPYQIGCFSKAQGCFLVGEPTFEFTWFPGYSWCYAMCDKCLNHLGWFYQAGEHQFYGLILNRLTATTI